MVRRVEPRHITSDLLVQVQSAIWANRFYKANENWSVVLEIFRLLTAILDGYECPLSRGPERLRQVDMRNDPRFRDVLMRQYRNDRPIYFLCWNRLRYLRTQEVRRNYGG